MISVRVIILIGNVQWTLLKKIIPTTWVMLQGTTPISMLTIWGRIIIPIFHGAIKVLPNKHTTSFFKGRNLV